MNLPRFVPLSQTFPRPRIDDVAESLAIALDTSGLISTLAPGASIAVTAGSRGIASYRTIIMTIVTALKQAHVRPFLVPAMGSHGGGTADGQVAVLTALGITESTIGAPIRASMETTVIGNTADGVPVYCDRLACASDGIVVVNRVKAHTAFHGDIESGLSKMLAVGLGNVQGAETMHRHGLGEYIPAAAQIVLNRAPVLMGVALLENAYDEIMDIRVVPPGQFADTDHALLLRNRMHLPGIPFHEFDILIVDEMGKDISGTGMDTNVIGFWRRYGGPRDPAYDILAVRRLTPASNGNAMGVGMADLITRQLADTIDCVVTERNARTSQPSLSRMPSVIENDRRLIETAMEQCGQSEPRIIRIRNTHDLSQLWITENMMESARRLPSMRIDGPATAFRFGADGNFCGE